jgi:CHAD domain-containing protein
MILSRRMQEIYYEKLWRKMLRHFTNFVRWQNSEDLHKMRVEVKKIKALIIFSRSIKSNGKLPKSFIPLKTIYRQAGAIRSIHIHLKTLEEYSLLSEKFAEEQNIFLSALTANFMFEYANNQNQLEITKMELLNEFEDVDKASIEEYFMKSIIDTDRFFCNNNDPDLFHEIRKILKNLMYNFEMINYYFGNIFNINKPYLDELQELIGKWNDKTELYCLLELQTAPDVKMLSDLQNQISVDINIINSRTINFSMNVRSNL